jgi:hypothetical protein
MVVGVGWDKVANVGHPVFFEELASVIPKSIMKSFELALGSRVDSQLKTATFFRFVSDADGSCQDDKEHESHSAHHDKDSVIDDRIECHFRLTADVQKSKAARRGIEKRGSLADSAPLID